MLQVSYRNAAGASRRVAVPDIAGVERSTILGSVIDGALQDAGPVSFIRLVTDTEASAEAGAEAAAAGEAEAGAENGSRRK